MSERSEPIRQSITAELIWMDSLASRAGRRSLGGDMVRSCVGNPECKRIYLRSGGRSLRCLFRALVVVVLHFVTECISPAHAQQTVAISPKLMGMPEALAQKVLRSDKLDVEIKYRAAPEKPGSVIGVQPPVNTKVQIGT